MIGACRAQLLSRPADGGIGRHYGIAFSCWGTPCTVIEKGRDGIYESPFRAFARLGDVRLEGTIEDGSELLKLQRRLERATAMRRPWDPLASNCEHFAREVFDGKSASYQVRAGLFLACVVGLLWAGSRDGRR